MRRKSSKGNPNHYPKGSPKGGQFAPKGVGMSVNHTQEYYDVRTAYRNGEMDEEEYKEKISSLEENVISLEEEKHLFRHRTPFTPATSIKEAEEYAKNTLGVKPYYKKMPLDMANTCNQCITEAFDQFPKLKERIKVIGYGQDINKEIKKRIEPIVAKEYQKKYEAFYPQASIDRAVKKTTNQFARKFSERNLARYKLGIDGRNDEKANVYNEYVGIYINKNNMKDTESVASSYQYDVKKGFHPEGTDSNPVKAIIDHEIGHALDSEYGISKKIKRYENVENGLSRYARTNKEETVAEAWCEYKNSEKPRAIAMEIGKMIEEEETLQ